MSLREILDRIDNLTLFLNLAFTQAILLLIGILLYWLFLNDTYTVSELFHVRNWASAAGWGMVFAVLVVALDVLLMKYVPRHYFDDGGINERLFRDVNVFHILVIALGVAIVEEWLFRAVLQNWLGLFWASLIFALVHVRYLTNWVYALLIIILSFGFGGLYEWTGSLWSVIVAHFLIDFSMGCLIRYRWFSFLENDS